MLEKLGQKRQREKTGDEADRSPLKQYAAGTNILETRATGFLDGFSYDAADTLRPRSDAEIRRIDRIQRRTIMLATLSGILSGAVIGGGEVWLRGSVLGGADGFEWDDLWWWVAFYAAVGVITLVEILYLYWNSLSGIARLRAVAGLKPPGDEDEVDMLTRSGLARAGLEFPNPQIKVHGVDPYALMPGWRLALHNVLYKLKVGATSFVLRILLRRVLARAALRGFVPLLAAPLYAAWNAIITWRIMREARIRALGPFAVDTLMRHLEGDDARLGDAASRVLLHGVAELTRRGYDAHPNYVLLIARLAERFAIEDEEIEVDWEGEAEKFDGLAAGEKTAILHVLTVAALLGTRVNRGKKRLLAEIYGRCDRRLDKDALGRMRKDMLDGRPISP